MGGGREGVGWGRMGRDFLWGPSDELCKREEASWQVGERGNSDERFNERRI